MEKTDKIKRCAWVIEYLMDKTKVTLSQLNEAWSQSYLSDNSTECLNRKTWYKCFEDIAEVYGILIACDKSNSKWYIENEDTICHTELKKWMLSCITQQNMLNECLSLNCRVDLEGFPSENKRLTPIVKSMKQNHKLLINYRKYESEETKSYLVDPFFIKSYKHRLYVLCQNGIGHFVVFSLDRIKDIQITKKKFIYPKSMQAKDFFYHVYGVMHSHENIPLEDVVIKAINGQQKYLNDVPMHHTQREIYREDSYSLFQITIYPTNDFIGDILQQGGRLIVMKPIWLKNKLKEIAHKMYETF